MTISPHHIKTSSKAITPEKKSCVSKLWKSKSPSLRTMRRVEEKKANRIKGKLRLRLC